jgi:hypothetical protein
LRRIDDIPGLFVIGKPDMTVVAFGSDVVDIFEVNDIMSSKGWHLNALQRPNRYKQIIPLSSNKPDVFRVPLSILTELLVLQLAHLCDTSTHNYLRGIPPGSQEFRRHCE